MTHKKLCKISKILVHLPSELAFNWFYTCFVIDSSKCERCKI